MVTDKDERPVRTGNGLLWFCLKSGGAALACTVSGWLVLCLTPDTGWRFLGFVAYLLWGFAALLVILLLCGIYVGVVNRNTLKRLSRNIQDQTYKTIVQPTKNKKK